MELGLSTSVLGVHALPDRLSLLAEHGMPWVEIHGWAREEFDFDDEAMVAQTADALARHGLRLWSCHSPAFAPLNVSAIDPDLRMLSIDAMRRAIAASGRLGARVFVCDATGPKPGDPEECALRRGLLAESLKVLLAAAGEAGLLLVIENHSWPHALYGTPEDFHALVTEFPLDGLGACWDTGHGLIYGAQAERACALGDHLITVHLHDNDGRRDLHLVPTEGGVVWEPFVACLRAIGYAGPFMMELAPPNEPTEGRIRETVARGVQAYRTLVGLVAPPSQPPR